MKKSTLLRKIAYPAAPQHADGFVPPAGYDYKMSVSLRNIDIKVYGFDGTSWNMMHNADGAIEDFITDVNYQKYYFESKTVDQQTVRVSFMSSEDEADTHTFSFGATSATRKLHHLGDVPIYRQSQAGKFLTVMSDGTLQWLGEDESYIVPSEGGGESNTPTYPEWTPVGDAAVVDGQLQTNGGYFSALWSDFVSYTGDTPDNTDFTVAFWWKYGEPSFTPTSIWQMIPRFGVFNGRTNSMNQGMTWSVEDHYSSGIKLRTNFGPSYFNGREDMVSMDVNVDHPWNHFVFTRTAGATKTYWNGTLVANHGASFPWVPNSATATIQLGAEDDSGTNSSQNTLFEDFEIRDGEAMSAADITALYDAGRVSQQSGGGGEAVPGTFLEELPAAANNIINSAYNSITNGIFTQASSAPGQKGATKVDLNVEGIMNYSGNNLDPKEWTLSFWIAAEAEISGGYNYCGGRFRDGEELRLAMGKTGDGFLRFHPIVGNLWTGTPKAKSTIPFAVGQFQHCAMTYSLSPGHTNKYDLKIFIDGVKGGEALQKSFHVLNKANGNVWFGLGMASYGSSFNGNGGMFSLDSVQLSQGALTEAQVAAIAAQSDRQMSIETAALQ